MASGLGLGLNAGMNSGSSSSSSTSSSSSYSKTVDSAISNQQAKILQSREQDYQDWFLPTLQSSIAETQSGSKEQNAQMALQAQNINQSFGASQRQIQQNLAQQGIAGNASGVQAALNASNQRSRASSLANAYYNTLANASSNRASLLQTGASLMTKPTTDVAYKTDAASQSQSESSSESTSSGFSVGGSVKSK